MNLIRSFSTWLRTRKLRNSFSRFVKPESIDEILSTPGKFSPNNIQTEEVLFILIQISDLEYIHAEQMFIKISELCKNSPFYIDNFLSSLILIRSQSLNIENTNNLHYFQDKLIQIFLSKFNKSISIIYGQNEAKTGNFGTDSSFFYGTYLKNFVAIHNQLNNLEPGSCIIFA